MSGASLHRRDICAHEAQLLSTDPAELNHLLDIVRIWSTLCNLRKIGAVR